MVFSPYKKTTNPLFNKMLWLDDVPTGAAIHVYVYDVVEVDAAAAALGSASGSPGVASGSQGVAASADLEPVKFCHGKCIVKPWVNTETLEVVASKNP